MKSVIVRSAILLAALAILVPAAAYAQPLAVGVSIPFAFSNGDRNFAAGDYIFRWNVIPNFVQLERVGGEARFMPLGYPGARPKAECRGRLVFQVYGDRYYIHGVERPGAALYEWPMSKAERETAKAMTPREVVLLVR
jgi:hypothetical protein